MKFPQWVDDPKHSDAVRASNRLKFILNFLCLQVGPRASVRELASICRLDCSVLSKFISRGYFSINSALKVEATFGKPGLADDLTNPLEIKTPNV